MPSPARQRLRQPPPPTAPLIPCPPLLPATPPVCSLEELQFALQELGVREAQAQSRAAAELLQLASAGEGGEAAGGGASAAEEQGDGTIGFEAFMALQRKARGWPAGPALRRPHVAPGCAVPGLLARRRVQRPPAQGLA